MIITIIGLTAIAAFLLGYVAGLDVAGKINKPPSGKEGEK